MTDEEVPVVEVPVVEVPADSILGTIKQMLGIGVLVTAFDTDILVGINTVFMYLYQLGAGPTTCFSITGNEEVWSDFLGDTVDLLGIKSLIYFKTKMLFDPPPTSFLIDVIERQIKELEWRIVAQLEGGINGA